MKKLYVCADIEGTCGIAAWDETERFKPGYAPFARQMSREVAAACEGALEAGMDEVLVRDAHDSALNIEWEHLPRQAKLIRGWAQDPYCMMSGLDGSFYGAVLTGCHDAAGTGSNPLSHTMDTGIAWMECNGERLSEARLNAYTAAGAGVPVLAVTGDEGVCARMQEIIPPLRTAGVSAGVGNSSRSVHPDLAVELIRDAVREACLAPRED
ncbi:MAG TPA: M55 family metallopeptidase, partial [Candidatus Limnocylindria bacterium]|nr:M55 family metallopeptidase [Candidatus Limnocylindria bacterium]